MATTATTGFLASEDLNEGHDKSKDQCGSAVAQHQPDGPEPDNFDGDIQSVYLERAEQQKLVGPYVTAAAGRRIAVKELLRTCRSRNRGV